MLKVPTSWGQHVKKHDIAESELMKMKGERVVSCALSKSCNDDRHITIYASGGDCVWLKMLKHHYISSLPMAPRSPSYVYSSIYLKFMQIAAKCKMVTFCVFHNKFQQQQRGGSGSRAICIYAYYSSYSLSPA